MKKLFLLAFAAFAFTACLNGSGDDTDLIIDPPFGTYISFEAAEGMKDASGANVVLGDVSVEGGDAAGIHHNVLWAKDLAAGGTYNGVLCTTAHGYASFGTYFVTDWGWDIWGGFVLTANYSTSITAFSYANQFTVWASSGVHDSSNCAIGYCNDYAATDLGCQYARPTIELVGSHRPAHLYMANTAMTYTYTPSTVSAADYYYKVIITGYLGSTKTGSAECVLINGASKVGNWKYVDLTGLGSVDRIEFTTDSNDANSIGILAPAYFAVDEIVFSDGIQL